MSILQGKAMICFAEFVLRPWMPVEPNPMQVGLIMELSIVFSILNYAFFSLDKLDICYAGKGSENLNHDWHTWKRWR